MKLLSRNILYEVLYKTKQYLQDIHSEFIEFPIQEHPSQSTNLTQWINLCTFFFIFCKCMPVPEANDAIIGCYRIDGEFSFFLLLFDSPLARCSGFNFQSIHRALRPLLINQGRQRAKFIPHSRFFVRFFFISQEPLDLYITNKQRHFMYSFITRHFKILVNVSEGFLTSDCVMQYEFMHLGIFEFITGLEDAYAISFS